MTTSLSTASTFHAQCPTKELLRDYLVGLTDEFVSATIDRHIESCQACNLELQQMESQDLSEPVSSLEKEILADAVNAAKHPEFVEVVRNTIPLQPYGGIETVGPYHLLQSIGRGGMGRVFQVEHTKLQKIVAVKLLPLHSADPYVVERFEREVLATGKLNHPSIVSATDAGIEAGIQYLAMEFIDGWDLGKLLQLCPKLSIPDVCEIGRQVALGLSYAHSLGMVHRDIKPSNIMLDTKGHIKLLDFGLVLIDRWDSPANELTTVGQFLGTLDYMAPEQAERSAAVDHRSDLYSLGATLFRLLTGQLPLAMLPNQSPLEKLRCMTHHSPIKVQTLRSEVPKELASIVDQLLSTKPENRLGSAAHLAQVLEPLCEGAQLRKLADQAAMTQQDSLVAPACPVRTLQPESPYSPKVQASHRFRWPWWSIAVASLLPFGIYFGVTFILENDRGNLVIESEVDNVKVRLKPKAGAAKQLQIAAGNTLSKLPSQLYDITIEAASDAVTIEPSSIVIQKGGTVVARIREQQNQPSTSTTNDRSSETPFSEISLPRSITESQFKGRSIEQILSTIVHERDYSTWVSSAQTLYPLLDADSKAKISGAVKTIARRNGFLTCKRILGITDYLNAEEIDDALAKSLEELSSEEFVDHVSDLMSKPVTNQKEVDWLALKKTWKQIDDRLRQSKGMDLILSLRGRPLGSRHISLEKLWYSQFRWLALACIPSNGMGFSTQDEANNSDRWRCLTGLVQEMDLEQALYVLSMVYPSYQSKIENETQFWQAIKHKLEVALEDWTKSNRLFGEFGNTDLYLLGNNQGVSVAVEWAGGVGGGMGGGMRLTASGPNYAPQKLPVAINVLLACERLPLKIRPSGQLSLLENMLQSSMGDGESRAKALYDLEWMRLVWSGHQDQLCYRDKESNEAKAFNAEDRVPVTSYVLHRWVHSLVEGDSLRPGVIADQFFRNLIHSGLVAGDQLKSQEQLVQRAQGQWTPNKIETVLKSIPLPHHNLQFTESNNRVIGDTAHVEGRIHRNLPGVAATHFLHLELELESRGWRVRKMSIFDNGVEEVVFSF